MLGMLPADVRAGDFRLFDCVVHGFETHMTAIANARMNRAIARRVNIWIGRSAALIDDDSVFALDARSLREFNLGQYADADDDEVGRNLFAVRALHGAHAFGAE